MKGVIEEYEDNQLAVAIPDLRVVLNTLAGLKVGVTHGRHWHTSARHAGAISARTRNLVPEFRRTTTSFSLRLLRRSDPRGRTLGAMT